MFIINLFQLKIPNLINPKVFRSAPSSLRPCSAVCICSDFRVFCTIIKRIQCQAAHSTHAYLSSTCIYTSDSHTLAHTHMHKPTVKCQRAARKFTWLDCGASSIPKISIHFAGIIPAHSGDDSGRHLPRSTAALWPAHQQRYEKNAHRWQPKPKPSTCLQASFSSTTSIQHGSIACTMASPVRRCIN